MIRRGFWGTPNKSFSERCSTDKTTSIRDQPFWASSLSYGKNRQIFFKSSSAYERPLLEVNQALISLVVLDHLSISMVSWYGSGSDKMIRIRPNPDPDPKRCLLRVWNFSETIFQKQKSILLGKLRHVYKIYFSQKSKMCLSNEG